MEKNKKSNKEPVYCHPSNDVKDLISLYPEESKKFITE